MNRLDRVNVKQGTASIMRFSNGNTLPITALPHALAMFAPQTDGRDSWYYHPTHRSIEGIRLTHQPSPWIGDFSYFTFMPQSDTVRVGANERWSGFRPEDAELHPHYMKYTLLRYGATISLAPTDSGAVMKLEYDETVGVPRFAVCPAKFDGKITVDAAKREIYGYTTSKNRRPQRRFKCYFVFKFDCDISDVYVTNATQATIGTAKHCRAAGANVALSDKRAEVSLAISYISVEQARLNLSRDATRDYEATKEAAAAVWEELLGKIDVEGDEDKLNTFYSCMYRAFVYPTKLYEVDAEGNELHVVPTTGEVKKGVMYTNNGFWDTFRTVYPLYSLLIPEKCNEIVRAWINFYDDTGYLPRWPSPSEAGCMPGTLIEAVLADAVVKGLLNTDDCERALTAMLKNSEAEGNRLQGRKCVYEYTTLGYVPYDCCGESVNETLDCAYGDFCIAQVADYLGKKELAERYYSRCKNYANLFDKTTGFMRAKNKRGDFRPDFCEYDWGRDYTEASAWQSSLAVQQDIKGLAELYGGKKEFLAFIDRLFEAKPRYGIGGYGGEIHEMTEMAAADFGQCAISNQPSFHLPYVYAELGENKRSAELVKGLVTAFTAEDDGFPGDEDNGTTACWYIFATLGFYPFCPGRADYVVTEPLFKRVTMRLDKDIDVVELLKDKSIVAQSDFIAPLFRRTK